MKPTPSDANSLYAQLFAKAVARYSSNDPQETTGSTDDGPNNSIDVNVLRKRRGFFVSNIDKEIMLHELQGQL